MKLRADNIVKYYNRRPVVDGVNIELNQGEIVGLLGPNGAGKTTSFYMMVGLVSPDFGNVYIGEENITRLPMYMRAQIGIGYLAQEASVFRNMTVEDNIKSVLEMTNQSKEMQEETCESLLAEFGLKDIRGNIGSLLSGGERRRTEIARALAEHGIDMATTPNAKVLFQNLTYQSHKLTQNKNFYMSLKKLSRRLVI